MNKIEELRVRAIHDKYPDTSFLGEYTDDLGPGVIIRDYEEFYEKIPTEMERDPDTGQFIGKAEPELPSRGRYYRGFRPYAGGEKVGTKEYYKYGMQDFKRYEGLNNGDWCFIGIEAEALVSYEVGNGSSRLETFTSGGLWGVESDSGEHLEEIKKEELDDLKTHLKQFNVDLSNWDELVAELPLMEDVEIEY